MKNSSILLNFGIYSNKFRLTYAKSAEQEIQRICNRFINKTLTNELVYNLKLEIFCYLNRISMKYNDLILQSYLNEIKTDPITFAIKSQKIQKIITHIDFNKLFLVGDFK